MAFRDKLSEQGISRKLLLVSILAGTIVIAAPAYVMYIYSNYVHFRIASTVMTPNILNADYVFVERVSSLAAIEYGDVIVFREEDRASRLGRVVAKPGDVIMYNDAQIIVNGESARHQESDCGAESVEIEYDCMIETLNQKTYTIAFAKDVAPSQGKESLQQTQVPNHSIFLLADCRNCGDDSRSYGSITFEQIVGRVAFKM